MSLRRAIKPLQKADLKGEKVTNPAPSCGQLKQSKEEVRKLGKTGDERRNASTNEKGSFSTPFSVPSTSPVEPDESAHGASGAERGGHSPSPRTASDPAGPLLPAPRSVSLLMLLGSEHMQARKKISCLQAGVGTRDA